MQTLLTYHLSHPKNYLFHTIAETERQWYQNCLSGRWFNIGTFDYILFYKVLFKSKALFMHVQYFHLPTSRLQVVLEIWGLIACTVIWNFLIKSTTNESCRSQMFMGTTSLNWKTWEAFSAFYFHWGLSTTHNFGLSSPTWH